MERKFLILGGILTFVLLVYAAVSRNVERPANLSALSAIDPGNEWFRATVLESESPVLVEFTAEWCGYCKQLAVVLKDIDKEYGDRIKIVPVDVDQHPDIASAYEVTGLPLVLVIKDRKVVAYGPGMMRYETVESMIRPHLASQKKVPPKQDHESTSDGEEAGVTLSAVAVN